MADIEFNSVAKGVDTEITYNSVYRLLGDLPPIAPPSPLPFSIPPRVVRQTQECINSSFTSLVLVFASPIALPTNQLINPSHPTMDLSTLGSTLPSDLADAERDMGEKFRGECPRRVLLCLSTTTTIRSRAGERVS